MFVKSLAISVFIFGIGCDNSFHQDANSLIGHVSTDTETDLFNSCSDNGRCAERFCDQVHIKSGLFKMGSDEETQGLPPWFLGGLDRYGVKIPEHELLLDSFCIDKFEVTVERYAACVAAGVCDSTGRQWPDNLVPNSWKKVVVNHYPPECEDSSSKCPYHPVNCKTFEQAATYCLWIGRRLCSEAEWERAARGPKPHDRSHYPWGDAPLDEIHANVAPLGPGYLTRVDQHPVGVSREGVFNLIGNVFEWVDEYYAPYDALKREVTTYPRGAPTDKYRIARGGCFFLKDGHTNTDRLTLDAAFDWGCIGLRCCSRVL